MRYGWTLIKRAIKSGDPLDESSLTFTMSLQTQLTEQSSQGPGQPRGKTGSYQTVVRRKLTVKSIETKYQAIIAMYDVHLEIRKMNGLCFTHTKRFFRKIFKMETSSIIKIFVFLLNFLILPEN